MRLPHRLTLAVVAFVLTACSAQDSASSLSTDPGNETKLILTLSAETDTIPESTSKTLSARVTDVTGFVRPSSVSWISTDPNIASVANGLVTGMAQGVASIIASTTGAADTALVVVTENGVTLDIQPSEVEVAEGDTVDFVATLRTRSGDIIPAGTFTWTASDTSAASFLDAGILHAKREGELSVNAEAMMRRGSSTVRIFRAPVSSITLTPSTATVYKGASTQLVARLRDYVGRLVDRDVRWGSSDNSKATVDENGRVSGVGVGTVVITATAERKTASATIAVMSPAASTVELNLPSNSLLIGADMQASVTVADASGGVLTGKTVAYQSSNPSIATVASPSGLVRGVSVGSVTIRAIVDGVIAGRALNVRGGIATSIRITPLAPTLNIGQEWQLVGQVLDESGHPMSGEVAWSSSNPQAVSISATGLIQAISSGSSTVTATSGVLSASTIVAVANVAVASIRVSPTSLSMTSGQIGSITAEALDANQTVLAGRPVTWSSQNPTVATVTNSGVVTAIASGSTALAATIEGKSANVPITVAAAPLEPVATVSVTLGNNSLVKGAQTQGVAELTDAAGKVLSGRAVHWTTLAPEVATVSPSGLVTATGAGTVAIIAASEGKSGSASLTVSAPAEAPVARIVIELPQPSIKVGEQVQSVVMMFDAAGKKLSTSGRTISYKSDNAAVITVSSTGLVKGVKAGSTKMRATSSGVTGDEGVSVSGTASTPTIASIVVTSPTSALTVGQTSQASATARDAQGAALSGTSFTWTTSNAAVATVSGSGLVTAQGAGSANIVAAASGLTGNLSVTVTAPPPNSANVVASVTVSLSPASITIGGTSQATAVARNASGAVISGKTPTWSLGGSLLASITSSGAVSGLLAGLLPVTATIDGVSGSANLTISGAVAPPPPPPTPPSGATATILSLLGQTKTVAQTAAYGGDFAKYDQVFSQRLPAASADANWTNNYYDRAVVFYARYARTGDATFLSRAHNIALTFRKGYIEPNGYKIVVHQSQVRGLELHYRLTGDTMSRRAVVGSFAEGMATYFDPTRASYIGNTQNDHGENRIQAKVLQAALSSYRMGASFVRSEGNYGGPYTPATWPTKLRAILNAILSTQNANGSYSWKQICGGQENFMVGMLNDVLIEYYRDFEADPRIVSSIERANEYLWTTQWRPADEAFNYFSTTCATGGMQPAGDLNGLHLASFGWLYKQTGNSKWATRGDAILKGLVSARWSSNYTGSKQFNQAFSESYRYLGWRW